MSLSQGTPVHVHLAPEALRVLPGPGAAADDEEAQAEDQPLLAR
jgi:hypothetical protein